MTRWISIMLVCWASSSAHATPWPPTTFDGVDLGEHHLIAGAVFAFWDDLLPVTRVRFQTRWETILGHLHLLVWITMELHWRVKWRPPVWWKVFVHFDHFTSRFHGDHVPAICGLRRVKKDQVVNDRFDVEVDASRATPGVYKVYVGWWRGYDRATVRDTTLKIDKNGLLLGTIRITK